jgi:hypothetical protein
MQRLRKQPLHVSGYVSDRLTFRFGLHEVALDTDLAELEERLAEVWGIDACATALSRISRFNGNALGFVSVAQHSVLVAAITVGARPVDQSLARLALYHDAHEAITGDVPTPVKRAIGAPWFDFEHRIEGALRRVLRLPEDDHAVQTVKLADRTAYQWEHARWRLGWSVEHMTGGVGYDVEQGHLFDAVICDLLEHDRPPAEARGLFLTAAGLLR